MIEYELKGPLSQEQTRSRLTLSLKENKFPQAVIIDGLPGVGKKALAMELAKALTCTDSTQRPCGHCFYCKMVEDPGAVKQWLIPLESKEAKAKSASEVKEGSTAKTVDDYTQFYLEKLKENPYSINYLSKAAEISVDLVRSLKGRFGLKNNEIRCVIIAEADTMNESASNALLKILEEVPSNTYFILTTHSKEHLLQTIRSRCLSVHLNTLSSKEVKAIASQYTPEGISKEVLGLSLGSVGRAIYFAEILPKIQDLALEFLKESWLQNHSNLFFSLESADFKEASNAILFLELLGFLVNDLIRYISESPIRLSSLTLAFVEDLATLPSLEALSVALEAIHEASFKISTRRTGPLMVLQALSISIFDGYR
ncbi:MAG: AAA family ATPase [Fibrobacter sp.]|jgi:DNA polymerase-3 subunit delta'|nr:AAA family ATPase [Fibrobacter sp.]